ncbi:MAG: ASKHA domain-containing protein [Gammaproteobacteria bacterium]|nr:MAG: ASKHA domain-containing protein [Gammaproteobacteria bacterium]
METDGVERRIDVPVGTPLLDAALQAGVDIEATCGRRGKCRSCRVKVLSGDLAPATLQDTVQLGYDAVHERFRLSCQTNAISDCTILLTPPKAEVGHQILPAGKSSAPAGSTLDSGVDKHLVQAEAPMDENHQTSDLEELVAGIDGGEDLTPSLDVLRRVPEILRKSKDGITLTTFHGQIVDIEAGDTRGQKYGMAFDIGTTSIVGSLVDLNSGEQLTAVGGINPQATYGGDLMSRISFAQFDNKKLATLRGRVLNAINEFIGEASDKAGISPDHVYKIVIVGNTCMHHIFLGIDTSYVGLAPYAPVVRESIVVPARDIPLKRASNAHVCLLPIIAGFVGADTIAAVLATRIYESEETRVMVDIGTNGEIVMGGKDRLMACSAPAGPALEGGQIKHGMRAAIGAIERVTIDDDVEFEVVGDVPAIGICGSGLIDAAAKMLDANVLNPAGRLRHNNMEVLSEPIRRRFVNGSDWRGFCIAPAAVAGTDHDIVLTQIDIRQLQLAKGAIYSGVLMLQNIMKVADDDIAELMLAGGFGNYVSTESAVRIRLLPPLPLERITYVGNAAHLGAELALLSEAERRRASDIAVRIEHVALATRPDFQELFVDACNFGEMDGFNFSVDGN